MRTEEEKKTAYQVVKDIGLDVCAGDNDLFKLFGVDPQWAEDTTPTVGQMTGEYLDHTVDTAEYVISVISLGRTENERLFAAFKLGQVINNENIQNYRDSKNSK